MKPILAVGAAFAAFSFTFGGLAAAFTIDWSQHLGTPQNDLTWYEAGPAISWDGLGAIYVAGETAGDLSGLNAGATDTFLAKYNTAGALQWTRQMGTAGFEDAHGVAADSLGNIFVGGWTQGSLGGPNAGATDAFVSRYDAAGALQWTRQVGTAADDRAFGISADGFGNVYLSGWTFGPLAGPLTGVVNAFVFKFDVAGNQLWSRQTNFSTVAFGHAVAADSTGDVYLAGTSFGDAFLTKYDASGVLQWTATLASAPYEIGSALATDSAGNVFVTGYTYGNLAGVNAGQTDVFLAKYNTAGAQQWVTQFGSSGSDYGNGVAIDSAGNVLVTGSTTDNLFAVNPNPGTSDLYLARFDTSGSLLSSVQFGAVSQEFNSSLTLDAADAIYVAGSTDGPFAGPYLGGFSDVFVMKLVVPEPSGSAILVAASVAASVRTLSRSTRPRCGRP